MSKRVVILGAGIIGLSTALYCARKGHKVTVIDRQPARRDGCSFGNAGMIVPSHFVPLAAPGMVALGLKWMWNPESPFYIKPRIDLGLIKWCLRFMVAATQRHVDAAAPILRDLSLHGRKAYEELAEGGMDFGLVRKGLLMLCRSQHALDEEGHTAEKARKLGIPAEVLDANGTAEKDPGVTMDVKGSVYFPMDCHLSPDRLMAAMLAELQRLGVEFQWETEVEGMAKQGAQLHAARTTNGEIEADEFVLCGGVWTEGLAHSLRLNLPMQAGKGYSLTVPNPKQLPQLCSICTEARVAVTPMDGSLRFGGTMEIAGLDESITQRRVRGIVRSALPYFPAFAEKDFEGIQPWRGLRPCSPDGMPYIGRTGRWKNLTIATGHAMMGLSLGPITGKIAAGLIAGETSPIPLRMLSPDRF